MRVGDLVWCRWDINNTIGVIIKILYEDNIGEVYYCVAWSDGLPDSLEFEYDLVTKEEKCLKQET